MHDRSHDLTNSFVVTFTDEFHCDFYDFSGRDEIYFHYFSFLPDWFSIFKQSFRIT